MGCRKPRSTFKTGNARTSLPAARGIGVARGSIRSGHVCPGPSPCPRHRRSAQPRLWLRRGGIQHRMQRRHCLRRQPVDYLRHPVRQRCLLRRQPRRVDRHPRVGQPGQPRQIIRLVPDQPCSSADRYAVETCSASASAFSVSPRSARNARSRAPNGVTASAAGSIAPNLGSTRADAPPPGSAAGFPAGSANAETPAESPRHARRCPARSPPRHTVSVPHAPTAGTPPAHETPAAPSSHADRAVAPPPVFRSGTAATSPCRSRPADPPPPAGRPSWQASSPEPPPPDEAEGQGGHALATPAPSRPDVRAKAPTGRRTPPKAPDQLRLNPARDATWSASVKHAMDARTAPADDAIPRCQPPRNPCLPPCNPC
jgi:hypothetical protein